MATQERTITVEAVVTRIEINPVERTLVLTGEVRIAGTEFVLSRHHEDVTPLLNAEDIAAATRLATRAQAWADNKLNNP